MLVRTNEYSPATDINVCDAEIASNNFCVWRQDCVTHILCVMPWMRHLNFDERLRCDGNVSGTAKGIHTIKEGVLSLVSFQIEEAEQLKKENEESLSSVPQ